jgi:type III secretion protein SpaR/YscT/HrcT
MDSTTGLNDSYVGLFLSSAMAAENFTGPLLLLLLFMGRMLPIITLSPFFGSRVLPHPVKIFFSLTLFVIFLPTLVTSTTTPINFNMHAVTLLAKEILIGFLLGMLVSIPFIVIQTAGMLIDHQRGGASLMVNDPTIQNQSSPLGTMFNLVLIYVFFLMDGPFIFLDAVQLSYEIVPPDKFLNPAFFNSSSSFFQVGIDLLNKTMKVAAQMASPAILAILMTDVFLGIANRLAPQVQVSFLGLPLKSLLALTVLCIGWKVFVDQMVFSTYSWLNQIKDMLLMFKP